MRYIFILIVLVLTFGNAFSQEIPCGTTVENVETLEKLMGGISEHSKTTSITWLPIQVNVVRNSNGEGASIEEINKALANLNHYFFPADIQFYYCGSEPKFIINDQYYDFNKRDQEVLANLFEDDENAINLYLVNSITGNSGTFAGYTFFPDTDLTSRNRVFVKNQRLAEFPNGTTVHEFGHYFALYHTHEGRDDAPAIDTLGTENVARSGNLKNCDTTGDRICDTEADPNYSNVSNYFDANNCDYFGSFQDYYGFRFNPPIDNIMSYYPDKCGGIFTEGQYTRIRQGLIFRDSHTSYSLNCPPEIVANPGNLQVSIEQNGNLLTWNNNADNAFGYIIERSSLASTDGFQSLKNGGVGPNKTSYTDVEADPNITYWYRIRASNDQPGDYSNIASTGQPDENIVLMEYYIDNDPGYFSGNEIPTTPGKLLEANIEISMVGLTPGIHTLYIRGLDNLGNWSFNSSKTIYVAPNEKNEEITYLEYFFDQDPGRGQGIALNFTSSNNVEISESINLDNLSSGSHLLYFRARNNYGTWSFMNTKVIYIVPEEAQKEIVGFEWYLDNDPGEGSAIFIPVQSSSTDTTYDFNVNLPSNLSSGTHRICFRPKDESGVWGESNCHTFETPQNFGVEYEVNMPSCYNFSDGSIKANPIGGTPPFQFSWSNGQSTDSIFNLNAGDYILTITDNSGAQLIDSLTLEQPDILLYRFTVTQNDCFNDSLGRIKAELFGGTPPYNYVWSTGDTSSIIENLPNGNYTASVADANGCGHVKPDLIVGSPPAIELDTFNIKNETNNGQNGTVDISVIGGEPPFQFNWSNGITQEDLIQVSAGNYFCTVTDALGCSIIFGPFNVDNTTATKDNEIGVDVQVFPNPANQKISILINGLSLDAIDIEVIDQLGRKKELIINKGQNRIWELQTNDWSPGMHYLIINGSNINIIKKVIIHH